MQFTLTLWTKDPELARAADLAGVDRIGVDLETISKASRQMGRATWISNHTLTDLEALKSAVCSADLFVRCNALHPGIKQEVDDALGYGVRVLMLPNFTQFGELQRFVDVVAGRAKIVPLVERVKAVDLVDRFGELGIAEFHVGLNDLSIDLGLTNRIAVLGMPLADRISASAKANQLRFGIGGLGRAGDIGLPVPSDLVYAQHARLGSNGALIARAFFREGICPTGFSREIEKMRKTIDNLRAFSPAELEQSRDELLRRAHEAM